MTDPSEEFKVENQKVLLFGEIVVDSGSQAVFTPYMKRGEPLLGYHAEGAKLEGRCYVYVAPVLDSKDGRTSFWLFIGKHGDPAKDVKLGPYHFDDYIPLSDESIYDD